MSAKIRPDLESVEALLRKVKSNLDDVDKAQSQRVGAQLRKLNERIGELPQVSRIRPATIALNNLAVSFRDYDAPSDTLVDELDTAIDVLHELLEDPAFGITPDDLRRAIDDALLAKGVTTCIACDTPNFRIEIGYILVKPFDPASAPSEIPSAIMICTRCGCSWSHDLRRLGVLDDAD